MNRQRLRGLLLALVSSLVSRPPPVPRRRLRLTPVPEVQALVDAIHKHRASVWHWQRVMGRKPMTTHFVERQTSDIVHLTFLRDTWRKRALRVQARALRPPHRRRGSASKATRGAGTTRTRRTTAACRWISSSSGPTAATSCAGRAPANQMVARGADVDGRAGAPGRPRVLPVAAFGPPLRPNLAAHDGHARGLTPGHGRSRHRSPSASDCRMPPEQALLRRPGPSRTRQGSDPGRGHEGRLGHGGVSGCPGDAGRRTGR